LEGTWVEERTLQQVLERNNRLLSFDTAWTLQKTTPPTNLRCRGNVFKKPLSSNDRGIHKQTHRLSFDMTRTAQKTTLPTILLLCVFIASGTCLPSRCLATISGIQIYTHRLMGGIYEVRRCDGLRCHKDWLSFKSWWGGDRHIDTRTALRCQSLLVYCKDKESRLKRMLMKYCVRKCTGFIWLGIRSSGWFLYTW
jgi:hypothetical protein